MAHKTGLEEYYVIRGQKKMRFGYTTGSCAAAAARAAAWMLLTGQRQERSTVRMPGGTTWSPELQEISITETAVSCAVKKDGGDDPDITTGALIFATVSRRDLPGIVVDGGEGVGRVTLPGLAIGFLLRRTRV